DYTDDEHIILSHVVSCNALINKVAELTGYSAEDIRDDIALYSGKYISKLSKTESMDLINQHRKSVEKHRQSKKIVLDNINN
ncbi:MAG: hypothetical protein AAFR77_22130, partial [Cyanobacteria bacterium J06631_2]